MNIINVTSANLNSLTRKILTHTWKQLIKMLNTTSVISVMKKSQTIMSQGSMPEPMRAPSINVISVMKILQTIMTQGVIPEFTRAPRINVTTVRQISLRPKPIGSIALLTLRAQPWR